MSGSSPVVIALASLATAALAMTVTAVLSRRVGKVSIVDVTWGLVFVAIGWVALATGTGSSRSLLLAVLVSLWGCRLAWHIARRTRGAPEDPRYTEMLAEAPPGRRFGLAVRKVFLVQGLAAWFVALPLQVAATTDRPLGLVAASGVAVWLVGLAFEAVGDAQLAAFKRDPRNRGRVMDRGLWAWTRHPNYFGDAAVWWGLWLVAAEAWPGVLTVVSPIAMTWFLAFTTGARLLESHLAHRPGYAEYMARTSRMVPRPPRRS